MKLEFWIDHPGVNGTVNFRRKVVFEVAEYLLKKIGYWHSWSLYCDHDDWKEIPF